MKRPLLIVATALSVIVALASIAAVFVAAGAKADARGALDNATNLHTARLQVARAQSRLGESDIDDALAAARQANATAQRAGRVTARIVALLEPTGDTAADIIASARKGARGAVGARRRTEVAANLLGAIAGYQQAASRYSGITNRALHRILEALRETNRSVPGE